MIGKARRKWSEVHKRRIQNRKYSGEVMRVTKRALRIKDMGKLSCIKHYCGIQN